MITDTVMIYASTDPSTVTVENEVLYVSTDLSTWLPEEPYVFGRDVTILNVTYRRLDAGYYAWLRHKMQLAKNAMESGWLSSSAYETLRVRFTLVHEWAVPNLGRDALCYAVNQLVPARYAAPADETPATRQPLNSAACVAAAERDAAEPHVFPANGTWPFTTHVPASAVARVDAISALAQAHGWTAAALYQNRSDHAFPSGQQYGVVCFLTESTTIKEVNPHSIALEEPDGSTARIHNPDAVHDWCRT